MEGGDAFFDFLGDVISGALSGGAVEGGGRREASPEGLNPDGSRSATATYDRVLTGARPTLNINDQ